MAWITKRFAVLVVGTILVGIATPAAADSFSIFGGHREHRRDTRVVETVVVGTPGGLAPIYETYTNNNPYSGRNYRYYDREGYRYYRHHDGHILGRVLLGAVVGAPVVVAPSYETYTTNDPYYRRNYRHYDRDGYRYYRHQDGHVLGRVLLGVAIGRSIRH